MDNNIASDSLLLDLMDAASLRNCATRPFRFARQLRSPGTPGRFVELASIPTKFGLDVPQSDGDSISPREEIGEANVFGGFSQY